MVKWEDRNTLTMKLRGVWRLFDPTAFENMKVVLEGAVYDRDFIGDILVINRDDIVNLSTMSRTYKIEMELKKPIAPISISGAIELHASLHNLSSGYSMQLLMIRIQAARSIYSFLFLKSLMK